MNIGASCRKVQLYRDDLIKVVSYEGREKRLTMDEGKRRAERRGKLVKSGGGGGTSW